MLPELPASCSDFLALSSAFFTESSMPLELYVAPLTASTPSVVWRLIIVFISVFAFVRNGSSSWVFVMSMDVILLFSISPVRSLHMYRLCKVHPQARQVLTEYPAQKACPARLASQDPSDHLFPALSRPSSEPFPRLR